MTSPFVATVGRAWQRAEAAVAELTRRDDIAAADAPVAAVVRRSAAVRMVVEAIGVVAVAWRWSATRALVRGGAPADGNAPVDPVPFWAIAIGVAMAVHLIALAATPRAHAPLVWALPVALLTAAALVVAASGRVARRRGRHLA